MAFPDLPRLTHTVVASLFRPTPGACYIFGRSAEGRSGHLDSWQPNAVDIDFVEIDEDDDPSSFGIARGAVQRTIRLRSEAEMESGFEFVADRDVYLDITGLSHHIWAPVLRSVLLTQNPRSVTAIYAEPGAYTTAPNRLDGILYDLSERLRGLAPLPGFLTLVTPTDRTVLVPLLGFEGHRFRFLLSELEPPSNSVVPVLGVPGFRLEYPFFSILGNERPLSEEFRFSKVKLARANCPFDLAFRLRSIASDRSPDLMQVATIGTKPHALGAVLFALAYPDVTELVYDHPVRRDSRTSGTGSLCVYPLDGFIELLRSGTQVRR